MVGIMCMFEVGFEDMYLNRGYINILWMRMWSRGLFLTGFKDVEEWFVYAGVLHIANFHLVDSRLKQI